MAKGAINSDHVLILPILHSSSIVDLEESVVKEIEKYKQVFFVIFWSVFLFLCF